MIQVNSNAVVVRSDLGEETQRAFINLFKYAQQFYGQKVNFENNEKLLFRITNEIKSIHKFCLWDVIFLQIPDEFSFSMFYSQPPYADLIFQDATQQLKELPREKQHYRS